MHIQELKPLTDGGVPVLAPRYSRTPEDIPALNLRVILVLMAVGAAVWTLVIWGAVSLFA